MKRTDLKFLLPLFTVFCTFSGFAQSVFKIDDFSDRFYAMVEFYTTYPAGDNNTWVTILDKEKKDTLFHQEVLHISQETWQDSIYGQTVNKPYKEQNLIFYEDLNFDGINDFSIAAWTRDPGNWRNYKVYLGDENGDFTLNKELSEITHGPNGMFRVDEDTQEYILENPRVGYDEYIQVYKVFDGKPILMRGSSKTKEGRRKLIIIESEFSREHPDKPIQHSINNRYLDPKNRAVDTLMAFSIPEKNKEMYLLSYHNQLNYVLTKPGDSIEHHHSEDFIVKPKTAKKEELSFQEGRYILYETEEAVGIEINYDDKKYDWKGDKRTQKGSLKEVLEKSYKNSYKIREIAIPESPYYGQVLVKDNTPDSDYLSGEGWVKLFDKKTDKELIKVESTHYFLSQHKDSIKANIQELPYGEQSVLIYEDFNFDGKKDLAISDGNYSCYGGPSYRIYLTTENGLEWSESFTELAQEFCGMFTVNHKEQTLETMTKSGCCWHLYSTYSIKDNQPYLIERIEEDASTASGLTTDYTFTKRKNGELEEKFIQKLNLYVVQNDDGSFSNQLLNFFEFENGKKMYFFIGRDEEEVYAFTNADDEVELLYNGPFTRSDEEHYAKFDHKGVTYKILFDRLEVTVDGKTHVFNPKITKGGNREYFNVN